MGINSADLDDTIPRELEIDFYGFSEKDMNRSFILPPTTFIGGNKKSLTLKEIITRLKVYFYKLFYIKVFFRAFIVIILELNICT